MTRIAKKNNDNDANLGIDTNHWGAAGKMRGNTGRERGDVSPPVREILTVGKSA